MCLADEFSRRALRRISVIFGVAAYVSFIAWFYTYVADRFIAVQGYGIKEVEATVLGGSLVLAVLPAVLLPARGKRASALLLWILYLMHVVPSVVVFPFLADVDTSRTWVWQAFLCGSFILTIVVASLPVAPFKIARTSPRLFFIVVSGAAIVLLATIFLAFGIDIRMSLLTQVYEQRAEFIERIQTGPALVGYAVVLTGYWLAPVLILTGLRYWKRRRVSAIIMVLWGGISSGYIYSVAAYKSIALVFVVVAACWWVYHNKAFSATTLLSYMGGLILVFSALRYICDVGFPFDHLLRRALIVPGMNAGYTFDYFSTNSLVFGAHPPSIVSSVYYGTDGSANAGFLAAAFPRYGYLGVLATGFVAGCVLWMVDSVTRRTEFAFAAAMFLMQAYAMANSALPTVLVSYGLSLGILTALILPRRLDRDGTDRGLAVGQEQRPQSERSERQGTAS